MKGWSKKRLVEITEKIGSGATPRGGNDAYKESGISLFRSLNVHDGFFREKNLAFIDEDQANKLSNVQVQEGDVLLNITGAQEFEINIPPLSEQKRIVSIVDEAFEAIDIAIDNTKQNLANARELFDSYLNAIFSKKGNGWKETTLGTLITVLTDYHANGSYEKLKQNVTLLDEDSYAYMVRSTDFENNFTNSLKYIDQHAYEFLSKSKVFADDIIISKIGNAGKVYLMPKIDRPCSLAMNLFLLRTKEEKIRSNYLYFFLESQFAKVL